MNSLVKSRSRLAMLVVALLFLLLPIALVIWLVAGRGNSKQAQDALNSPVSMSDKRLHQFAHKVLLGVEFGSKNDRFCRSWSRAPKLAIYDADERQLAMVRIAVADINACLPEKHRIELLADEQREAASIHMHFVPKKEFEAVYQRYGLNIKTNWNLGYFYLNWRGYDIYRSVIMIADDKLKGSRLQHFILEELTQSLGLGTDSDLYPDSAFYENASKGEFGTAIKLSKEDRKLIRLLYNDLKPGTDANGLQKVLDAKWPDG